MTLRRVTFVALLACFSVPALAQQAPSTSSSQPDSQQAQDHQDQQPSPEQPDNDKKKDSKVKRKLKELVPSCVGISGGTGKCHHSQDDQEEAKREAADQDLRQQCRDASEHSQPESQACADLHRRDAAHDVEVGDSYLEQKSYNAAAMRYRSALQADPANATAMLHYAQALEKLSRKTEAYQQYQDYLKTDPSGDDAKRARSAMERLAPGASASK
jgi:tetratricopeptide (TPR) repeat protein